MATHLGPGQDDLCAGGLVLLGDLEDGRVVDEQGLAEAVVAESTVGSDVDALLLEEGQQLVVLQEPWVSLDLIGSGHDTGGLDDGLDVLDGEVGDANVLSLGLGQGNHGLPGVDERHAVVELDLIGLVGGCGEQVAAHIADKGEGHGPVDEVEVKVVELELSEGVIEGLLNVLGAMGVVPQLGGDEEVLALETELFDALVQTLGDLLLVLVDLGQIEVAVASLESLVDANGDLTGLGLPGAVAESAVNFFQTRSVTSLIARGEFKSGKGGGWVLTGSPGRKGAWLWFRKTSCLILW